MNNVERFTKLMNFQEVDRLPVMEWAGYWDATVRNWYAQGLPAELHDAWDIRRYFGFDSFRQYWISPRGADVIWDSAHGIGVVNAYLVSECGSGRGVLFDTGAGLAALEAVWPRAIEQIDAVFLTHVEAEHAGGLCEVVARFGVTAAFVPEGAQAPCGRAMAEGAGWVGPHFTVTAFSTPGHVAAHNCYLVEAPGARPGSRLLVSGDLLFAGSVGGAYFCNRRLQAGVRRVLDAVPPDTVIAPGHGPLTTAENERRFNPFVI